MLRRILVLFLFALPIVGGAVFIHHYGVDLLRVDEFEYVPLATSTHLPDLADLFRQHNEHRILFPSIVYFYLAKASAMNSLVVMWVSFAFVTTLYGAALWQLSRRVSGPVLLLSGFLFGCALFYPSQWDNFLWSFEITFLMAFVFPLLAIFCFQNTWEKDRASTFGGWLALAMLCAVIASFSSSQGLLVWPAIILLWLIVAGKRALVTKPFWLWLAASIAVWALYFHDYAKPPGSPSPLKMFVSPIWGEEFILALFGSAFGWSESLLLIGALGILILGGAAAIMAFFIRDCRAGQPAGLFAAGAVTYSLLCGLAISVGRTGFGWQEAINSPRYSTFTLVAVWGIILYLAVWLGQKGAGENRPRRLAAFLCLAFIAVVMAVSLPLNLRVAEDVKNFNLLRQYYLRTADWQADDKLHTLYPAPDSVRMYAAQLRDRGYNAFAGLAALTPDWQTIERIAAPNDFPLIFDQVQIKADTLVLRGWSFDPEAAKPARSIWLDLGEKRFLLFSSAPHPDVACGLKNKALTYVGFMADIPLTALPSGSFPLRFAVVSNDGNKLYEVSKNVRLVHDATGARLERRPTAATIPLAAQTPDWQTIERVAAPNDFPLTLDQADITADTLVVRGWCFDPQTAKPARSIWLDLGEKRFFLFSRVLRPDVACAWKNKALTYTGFMEDIPLAALPSGSFPLRFAIVSDDGSKLYEVTKNMRLVHDDAGVRLEKRAPETVPKGKMIEP